MNRRETGSRYEKQAAVFLEQKGYEILEMNFRCRRGEIDLVARDGEYLVFVEVKYRADLRCGRPGGGACESYKKCILGESYAVCEKK